MKRNRISAVAQVLALAGTLNSCCLLVADVGGSVIGWGDNTWGQTVVPEVARDGVVALAAGPGHVLALKSDGSLWGWGDDRFGQLQIPAGAALDVISMAAGGAHSLAVTRDRRVLAWGSNASGQTDIPPIAKWGDTFAVAAGSDHSLLIRADGYVLGWGDNSAGQTTIPYGAYSKVVTVAASGKHNLALRSDGTVVAWGGSPELGQIPLRAQSLAVAVAAGPDCNVVLRSNGEVVVWGNPALSGTNVPAGVKRGVVAIAAGERQIFALKPDGSVVSWGANESGQIPAPLVPEHGVRSLASAGAYGLAIVTNLVPPPPPPLLPAVLLGQSGDRTNGVRTVASFSVRATGKNLRYRWTKDGVEIPEANGSTLNCGPLRDRDAGLYTAFIENDAGTVTSEPMRLTVFPGERDGLQGAVAQWGAGWWGAGVPSWLSAPVPSEVLQGVVSVAAGWDFNMALCADGRVVSWAPNGVGASPLKLPPEAVTDVTAISVYASRGLSLKADGTVIRWRDPREPPMLPPGPGLKGPAVALACENVVLLRNGVVTWTDDLGEDYVLPEAARSDVIAISASRSFFMALRADGRVVCWKDGSGNEYPSPAAIQGHVVRIAAGNYFGAALLDNGSVATWGDDNRFGQLNVPPAATSGVTELWARCDSIFVRRSDGSLLAWGADLYGELRVPQIVRDQIRFVSPGQYATVSLVEIVPPSVLKGPDPQEVIAGTGLSFVAEIQGYPLGCQWFLNGVPVAGATNATLSIPSASAAEFGDYTVVVTNRIGSATNAVPASLKVRPGRSSLLLSNRDGTVFFPVPAEAQNDVAGFASGLSHRVVLNRSGHLFAWGGSNEFGQLSIPAGAEAGGLKIAAGANHTLVLGTNGAVVAWGDNRKGQCDVPPLARSGIRSIAAAGDSSYAVTEAGDVVAWGDPGSGGGGIPPSGVSDVNHLVAIPGRVVAVRNDGTALAWSGSTGGFVAVPKELQGTLRSVALTSAYCYALLLDGSVVGWEWGKLNLLTPAEFHPGPESGRLNVASLSAADGVGGVDTVFAVRNDGGVAFWNYYGIYPGSLPANPDAVIRSAIVGTTVVGLITETPESLETKRLPAALQVSWSSLFGTAQLQSSASLDSAGDWSDVKTPLKDIGGRRQAVVPLDAEDSIRWFRLNLP